MYNLIEHKGNYSKTSRNLHQLCKAELNNPIAESESFKFKSWFLNNTNNAGMKSAEIPAPLKYLRNFSTTLEIP